MLLLHIAERSLTAIDHRFKTDTSHEINFFVIVFVSLFGTGDANVIDPDIQAAEFLIDMLCKTVIGFCIHDIICLVIDRTVLGKCFCGFFELFFVARSDGNAGTFLQKCFCCSVSDPLAASGDYDGFSG